MNRYLAAVATLLLLAVQPCAARAGTLDPPRYDSDVFCRLRANTPEGFSDDAQSRCLGQQRFAYDAVRREWNELSDETQTNCDQLASPDYEALRSCIETQKRRLSPAPAVEGQPQ